MHKPIGIGLILLGVVVLLYNVWDTSFGDWQGRINTKLIRTLWVRQGDTDYRLGFNGNTYYYGYVRAADYSGEGTYEIIDSRTLKCVGRNGVTFYPHFEFHGENLLITGWWSTPALFLPHNPPY